MNRQILLYLSLLGCITFTACEKEPGEGGTSTINGQVFVRDYDENLKDVKQEYYAPEEDVYIVYGEDYSFSDKTETSYDGKFHFKYLRPGKYRVFVYSKDSTNAGTVDYNPDAPKVPVFRDVEIKENNKTYTVEQIDIIK